MEFPFDIFEIYRRYCDIMSRAIDEQCDGCSPDELQKARISREALAQLWKMVESRISQSVSILDEIQKLMSRLDLMAGAFSEFSRFYDFVFFISRENGQKNITVGRAVMAWRLVLSGRFRLLNQWCNFVEKNQRYNISEDTWRQVLAFSRCVHENLEGYDPKGAWPVLIDEFVEYMYRVRGSHPNFFCNCGDSDSEPQQGENTSSGLTNIPGSKRKLAGNLQMDAYASSSSYSNSKRRFYLFGKSVNWGQDQVNCSEDDCVGKVKQSGPLECSMPPCSVEGCLSKGFAGLLSGQSGLKFDQDRRVSYT